jgi:hypothetical protein
MALDKPANQRGVELPPKGRNIRKYISWVIWFAVLTSIFALAYNQSPLYTSNQNQYFLHGYAQAGYGLLGGDWLANTADPTPVFTFLVAATLRLFHTGNLFFVYYALLMGVYFFSLFGIVENVFHLRSRRLTSGLFIAVIIVLYSTVFRYLLQRLFGGDWPYLFEGGVAGQRLLGPVFQPSSFGVFLLLSIYLYLADHKSLAVLSAALAATFHPTYLLSAAALTLAYLIDSFQVCKKIWPVIKLGALSLAAVAPILIYTYIRFWGGNAEIDKIARDILVNFRIPPHAIVADWFNATVVIKLAFVAAGLVLTYRKPLFWVLLIPLCLSIGLTVIQVITSSDALALIFPWRLSTWLVPISVGLIIARFITLAGSRIPISREKFIEITGLVFIGLAMTGGMVRTYLVDLEWRGLSYRPVEAFVRSHRQAGQQVLTPADLYDFRLETGVPVYVDFLSIPYASAEVIEWDRRYSQESFFYQRVACDRLAEFSKEGVTQVVLPADFPKICPQLIETYRDSAYKLYNLVP